MKFLLFNYIVPTCTNGCGVANNAYIHFPFYIHMDVYGVISKLHTLNEL